MSKEIRAGGAFIEIYLKERERLDAKFKSYKARLDAFARGVAMVGGALSAVSGAALGGLGAAFASFTGQGDKLTDTANRLGITTQRLQELTYAAGQSGATMEDVERAMLQAQKKGLDFERVAATIAKIEDPMKRTQAAFAAFGKAGPRIAPMLAQLSELSAKANRLGLVFKPEDVSMAGKLADMWGTLKAQAASIAFHVGSALAPAMEKLFTITQGVLAASIKFVDTNRGLVVGLAITAGAVGALGGALLGMAGAAWVATQAMVAFTAVSALVAGLGAIITAPIALMIAFGAAIATAATYWVLFTDSGQAAWKSLMRILDGMFNAISSGNIALAFQIAWQGVLVAFDVFSSSLMTKWSDMIGRMLNMLTDAKVTLGLETVEQGTAEKSARVAAEFRRRLEAEMNTAGGQARLDALIAEAARGAAGRGDPATQNRIAGLGGGSGSGTFGAFNAAVKALAGRTGAITVEQKQLDALEGIEGDMAVIRKAAEEGSLVFA